MVRAFFFILSLFFILFQHFVSTFVIFFSLSFSIQFFSVLTLTITNKTGLIDSIVLSFLKFSAKYSLIWSGLFLLKKKKKKERKLAKKKKGANRMNPFIFNHHFFRNHIHLCTVRTVTLWIGFLFYKWASHRHFGSSWMLLFSENGVKVATAAHLNLRQKLN